MSSTFWYFHMLLQPSYIFSLYPRFLLDSSFWRLTVMWTTLLQWFAGPRHYRVLVIKVILTSHQLFNSIQVRSGPIFVALLSLLICKTVPALLPGVFCYPACSWSRLKIPVLVANIICRKLYAPLPSMRLLQTDNLSCVGLQDSFRIGLLCFLHHLAVETSSKGDWPKFLACSIRQVSIFAQKDWTLIEFKGVGRSF